MSGEKHVMYSPGTGLTTDVMQSIYTFVNTHGSTCGLRIASDGGTYATHNGSALGTPDGTAGWWATAANAYMVVEPVATMPGGSRWQCKIIRNSTSVLQAVYAPLGGWTVAAPTYSGLPVSAATQWNDGTAPGASCNTYISGSDLNTYSGGASAYTYLRVLGRRTANAEDGQWTYGLRIGGYVPHEPSADTKPSVMLCRTPTVNGGSASWSYATANSSCPNRAPVDDVHTTTDYSSNGHCYVNGQQAGTSARSRNGKWTNKRLYLYNIAGAYELGSFGPTYDMTVGNFGRSDAAADSGADYLVVNDLMVRWKPSA